MGELERVVGEKTELIGRFTRLMEEWRGQHIRKQQILANMKDNLLLGEI